MRRRRRSGGERSGTPADWLVVGLGNPGRDYAATRHNVGAEAVAALVERHGGRLRSGRQDAWVDEVRVGGRRVALAIPKTYMNESGLAVGKLVRRFGVEPERLVVVHDELDLPTAALRVKLGGGLAGHKGLRSIVQHVGTPEFVRVRIGVGKPARPEHGADHVLARFTTRERTEIEATIGRAADALDCLVEAGVDEAMNRFNTRP